MVTIGCTRKLLDRMKLASPTLSMETDPLFAWTAAMSFVDKRMMVVFTHDETRFSIVYHGVRAKELRSLPGLFRDGLMPTMLASNISPALVEWYCVHCGDVIVTKTASPKAVARSNKSMIDARWQVESLSPDLRLCLAEASFINRFIHGIENNEHAIHVDSFASMIAERMGYEGPAMVYPGYRIKAVLETDATSEGLSGCQGVKAFMLTVPANDSFRDLATEINWAFQLSSRCVSDSICTFLLPGSESRVNCIQNVYSEVEDIYPAFSDCADYQSSTAVRLADMLIPGLTFPYIYAGDQHCRVNLTVKEKIEDIGTGRTSKAEA